MSEDFKERLRAYKQGELSEEEMQSFEKELEKLENNQSFPEDTAAGKRQRRFLGKGKWRGRIKTGLFVIGLFILISFVSSIITSVYYSWGSPERSEAFREIIDHTLTVTDPYGFAGHTSTGANAYFNMDAERDINKVVGKEWKKVGVLETKFIFSLMGEPNEKYNESASRETLAFLYPGEGEGSSDWNQLKKLPEGTVVSAYVSFAELMKTADVFRQFDDKDLDLLWLLIQGNRMNMIMER